MFPNKAEEELCQTISCNAIIYFAVRVLLSKITKFHQIYFTKEALINI